MLAKIHDRIKEQAKVKQADKWIRNPKEYIEDKLYIRTKDKQVIPLRFNPIQEMYWGEKSKRDIILKPRQLGFSTLTLGRFFECVINEENVTAVIIAHDADSTQKMFQMVQLMYEWLPEAKKEQLNNGKNKPKYGNRKEYFFVGNNSRIYVGTAGSRKLRDLPQLSVHSIPSILTLLTSMSPVGHIPLFVFLQDILSRISFPVLLAGHPASPPPLVHHIPGWTLPAGPSDSLSRETPCQSYSYSSRTSTSATAL